MFTSDRYYIMARAQSTHNSFPAVCQFQRFIFSSQGFVWIWKVRNEIVITRLSQLKKLGFGRPKYKNFLLMETVVPISKCLSTPSRSSPPNKFHRIYPISVEQAERRAECEKYHASESVNPGVTAFQFQGSNKLSTPLKFRDHSPSSMSGRLVWACLDAAYG